MTKKVEDLFLADDLREIDLGWTDDLADSIDGATTSEEIDEILADHRPMFDRLHQLSEWIKSELGGRA
jgi:hypothetical protein